MIDHDLPLGSHVAAVDTAREEGLRQSTRPRSRQKSSEGTSPAQSQQGDGAAAETPQQQGTIFRDWAAI